jgi:hypothetical protein
VSSKKLGGGIPAAETSDKRQERIIVKIEGKKAVIMTAVL